MTRQGLSSRSCRAQIWENNVRSSCRVARFRTDWVIINRTVGSCARAVRLGCAGAWLSARVTRSTWTA